MESPLDARSVLASTLLGTQPPRLPVSRLVRAAALFDITEGAARTALSRMVRRGELSTAGDGWYALAGHLAERATRQRRSRRGAERRWDGTWVMAVVVGDGRAAADRARLRRAATALRLAEWREGVWLRPANLDATELPEAAAVVSAQCRRLDCRPEDDPATLAAGLWDLAGWSERARGLQTELVELLPRIEDGDTSALAPGFVTSAAVLRHLQADPLLPEVLWPSGWAGPQLRADYDAFDSAYRRLLGEHLRGRPSP